MNPRQRRGVLLMVLSGIAAVLVFVGVSSYVASVNSRVGPMVTIYRVTTDLPAFTTLSSENTEPAEVPERWAADNTVLRSADIDGRVIATPMTAGSPVSLDILVPPSDLDPTEREIAVNVDAVTGLAGRGPPSRSPTPTRSPRRSGSSGCRPVWRRTAARRSAPSTPASSAAKRFRRRANEQSSDRHRRPGHRPGAALPAGPERGAGRGRLRGRVDPGADLLGAGPPAVDRLRARPAGTRPGAADRPRPDPAQPGALGADRDDQQHRRGLRRCPERGRPRRTDPSVRPGGPRRAAEQHARVEPDGPQRPG